MKWILPNTLSCTIRPISWSLPSLTITVLFITFAGRVICSSTRPAGSAISSLWVMNWSKLVSRRNAFFAALWPTWLTAAICWPLWLNTPYWLFSSISLAFWLTTRIGSVKIVPPPTNAASPTFALR